MAYCTASEVFDLCGLTSSDVSSSKMLSIIRTATTRINADINLVIREERANFIDQYRQNKRNGTNTVFYVQDSYKYFLGDYDNDGDVDISDVEVWLYDPSAKTKTSATISAVNWQQGKITLTSAPDSNNYVYITYARAPLDESTPHRLIKEACKALSASLAYMKIRAEDYQKLNLGDFAVTAYAGGQTKNSPFGIYAEAYDILIDKINSGELLQGADIPNLRYLISTEPW